MIFDVKMHPCESKRLAQVPAQVPPHNSWEDVRGKVKPPEFYDDLKKLTGKKVKSKKKDG